MVHRARENVQLLQPAARDPWFHPTHLIVQTLIPINYHGSVCGRSATLPVKKSLLRSNLQRLYHRPLLGSSAVKMVVCICMLHTYLFRLFFWPCNLVKRSICYTRMSIRCPSVCPSVCNTCESRLNGSRAKYEVASYLGQTSQFWIRGLSRTRALKRGITLSTAKLWGIIRDI